MTIFTSLDLDSFFSDGDSVAAPIRCGFFVLGLCFVVWFLVSNVVKQSYY